ncbi:MAG TPA: Rrf2 family transcriptional regulator [Terriglobia bacterium]|nr:Rrf2 family transcriptional regulator [Terriglobia bacterium]
MLKPPYLDTRIYYSLKCLVCLAEAGAPRQSKELATLTGITPAETAKVLSLLAWGGFLLSKRGSKGGFWLRLPAAQIQIKDVMKFLQRPGDGSPSGENKDSVLRVWRKKVGKVSEDFEKLSLAELVRESHQAGSPVKSSNRKA